MTSLSDKIRDTTFIYEDEASALFVEDVKEAVKKLKDGFLESVKTKTFDEFVDEIFGEKLI